MYIALLGSILITIMIIVSDGTEHILFELLAGWLDEPKRSLFAFPFLNEKSFRTYEEEVNQGIPHPISIILFRKECTSFLPKSSWKVILVPHTQASPPPHGPSLNIFLPEIS